MTPQQKRPDPATYVAAPPPPTPKWWQSLLAGAANTALTILLGHYLGPAAGFAAGGLGTVAAFHHQIKK